MSILSPLCTKRDFRLHYSSRFTAALRKLLGRIVLTSLKAIPWTPADALSRRPVASTRAGNMTMRLDPNMISILGPVNPSDQAGSLPDQTTLTCKLWIADAFLMWVPYRVTHKLTLSSRDAEHIPFLTPYRKIL